MNIGDLYVVMSSGGNVTLWDSDDPHDTSVGILRGGDIVILLELEQWDTWGHLVLTKCGLGRVGPYRLKDML